MRVLRDVIVDRTGTDELMAVSHVPGIVGEEMALDLLGAGESLRLTVQVLESRPLVVDGAVRHRIRLALVNGSARGSAHLGAPLGLPAVTPAEAN